MRVNSEVGSVGHRDSRSVRVGAEDSSHGDFVNKKKKKKKEENSNKKLKSLSSSSSSKGGKRVDDDHHHGVVRFGQSKDKYSSQLFKSCVNLLEKLMKHKFGWVFNVPVDVKGLGLLDYNSIIKHPMDLGTVKSRLLNKTLYKSPIEFADDVRLTFNNAMLYNPKGQDVHSMAEQLLKIFEDRWAGIEKEFNLNKQDEIDDDDEDDDVLLGRPSAPTRIRSARSTMSTPPMRSFVQPQQDEINDGEEEDDDDVLLRRPSAPSMLSAPAMRSFNQLQQDEIDDGEGDDNDVLLRRPSAPTKYRSAPSMLSTPAMKSLDRAESVTKPVNPISVTTTPIPKKPKPMEAVKRDMTYEEKQMLSTNLQNLPSEKLDNVVQIIKKRTPGLSHQEDEIEVDIASLEAETLWELDRFVNSYKRSLMSTNKRKEM
ncbi:transcription factor GTE3, chloroplastic [Cannabis sativa]|uniref:transcription factor GTE3, chloroplastic n=1 Tax=Cannabis sativa TaxID=3483 RepID=UPI0029CA7FF8|nr:transcription factor GTE3, chloroplastic [Cannabis sativa]